MGVMTPNKAICSDENNEFDIRRNDYVSIRVLFLCYLLVIIIILLNLLVYYVNTWQLYFSQSVKKSRLSCVLSVL